MFSVVWTWELCEEVISTTSIPTEWTGGWRKDVLLTVLEEDFEVLNVSVVDWESTAMDDCSTMGFAHQLPAVGLLEVSGISSYQESFWEGVSWEREGKQGMKGPFLLELEDLDFIVLLTRDKEYNVFSIIPMSANYTR